MKKSILLIGMLSLFLSVVPAFGQVSGTKCTAKVPFDFVVGNTVLPAGDYAIQTVGGSWNCFVIVNKETGTSAWTFSRDILLSPGSTARNTKWVFAHEGNRYVLHQVKVEGDNRVHDLIHSKEIAELAGTK